MKICSKCGIEKEADEFGWKNKSKGIRQYSCKACAKLERDASRKDEFGKTKSKYIYGAKVKQRKQQIVTWLRERKRGLICQMCGESHPATLDFHHRDPKEKKFNITEAAHQGIAIARLELEIEKCEVLCCNCHRKEHYGGIV